VNFTNSPTLRLLNSSTTIALSGALRLHIAFLLAGIGPRILVYLAGGLIIYSTYTLDRSLGCEEDAINRSELKGSKNNIAIVICVITFLTGAFILAREKIYFASFFPFIVGYLYSKGLEIGRFKLKLKGSAGGKNIVVAFTWGGTIAIIVSKWNENIFTILLIFIFYGTKLFINSILYDFKDIKGDMAAGIKTLPVCIGENRTRKILFMLCLLMHCCILVSFLTGFIMPEPVILSYSFFTGIISISLISSNHISGIRKYSREIIVDGESTIALALRATIDSISFWNVP
jgi:4-hydroxybenzoate polyprenyltransferase